MKSFIVKLPIEPEKGYIKKNEGSGYLPTFSKMNIERISDKLIDFGLENIRLAFFSPQIVNPDTFEVQVGLLVQDKNRVQTLIGRYDINGNPLK